MALVVVSQIETQPRRPTMRVVVVELLQAPFSECLIIVAATAAVNHQAYQTASEHKREKTSENQGNRDAHGISLVHAENAQAQTPIRRAKRKTTENPLTFGMLHPAHQ
jgi:hypothetical protein